MTELLLAESLISRLDEEHSELAQQSSPQSPDSPLPQMFPATIDETAEQAQNLNLFEAVDAYEKELICCALRSTRGNRNQAAKLLRVSERALAYKLRKHKIDHADFRTQ